MSKSGRRGIWLAGASNGTDLRKTTQLKFTFIQLHEAFGRAVMGESVRAIAQRLGVTEGCLRFHFRKGTSPKEVRRLAFELLHAQQVRASLTPAEQRDVDRLVEKARRRLDSG